MFDVFYNGTAPNLFPYERYAETESHAKVKSRTKFFWFIDQWGGSSDLREFNFDWMPPLWEEHQTHIFPVQSQFEKIEVRLVPTTGENVDHWYPPQYLARKTSSENWIVLKPEANWVIDPSWAPNPFEQPYIYVFGNPWYSSVEMPTMEYRVPGATEYKYLDEIVTLDVDQKNFTLLLGNLNIDTLYGWAPNPFEQPYIYVFGNQHYSAEEMPTVEYTVPGATERKYVNDYVATLTANKKYWSVPEEVVATKIDFSWVPPLREQPYIYHFGSEFQISTGLTYTVPGATEIKFEFAVPVILEQQYDAIASTNNPKNQRINSATRVNNVRRQKTSITQVVSMFFVDMSNKTSSKRYEALKIRYPDLQKVRYINGWVETIKRCAARSETQKFWVISSENVYDDFNFEWHAQPWQHFMTHIFASQWQKWSDTFLINKLEFSRHTKWAKSLEEFPNLNFVSDQPVYRPDDVYDIYYVDHFNPGSTAVYEKIHSRYPGIKTARYVDNYLDTFKRIVSTAETEYIWIINSICDYSKFDFTWQPEPWQAKMLHVFPSDDQKFGDTFYVHVPTFKEQMDNIELLDWFDTVNYCNDQVVPRLAIDEVEYNCDTVVDVIKQHNFTGPFAIFKHTSTVGKTPAFSPSIWRKKDRVVHVFAQNGAVIYAPRECKPMLETQIYDYPYIMPHRDQFAACKNLDIVYISNGEPDEQRWYDHLTRVAAGQTIHWIRGIKGRENAYKAAALASTTPWFFATFAKLEVTTDFDWSWQPDYLQEPKHYMFDAINPVTGLQYGHMGIIAYNKKLVAETVDPGLDFTLSKAHESTHVLSGIAHYNVDRIVTWRTAFRECIKLRNSSDSESISRLQVWLTVAVGDNAEWSLRGAADAVEYFNAVDGDMLSLKLSFDWEWLDSYFSKKYST